MFDFFKKESPKVKGATISWWYAVSYNVNKQKFYDFYNQNPYINAVIGRIKTDVWAYGTELVKVNWEKTTTLNISILEDLLSHKKPTSIKDFTERLVRDIEVTWNAYVYLERNEWWKVIWITILDPRYITPIVSNTGDVLWYVQNLNWIRAFLTTEVFHFIDEASTEDETIWESKMLSLFLDLETDKEARESNLAFFKNNQTPSSIILLEDDFDLQDETLFKQKLKEVFASWQYTWWKNQYRTAFFQWIKSILPIQDKIDDMKFVWLRKLTMQLVCAVYGTPQDLIWFTETSNRSVWDVQYDIYLSWINSKENKLAKFINSFLPFALWDDIEIVFLQDNLRQLERKSKIVKELYKESRVINLDEAREIVQYDSIAEWWNEFYKWNDTKEDEKEKLD